MPAHTKCNGVQLRQRHNTVGRKETAERRPTAATEDASGDGEGWAKERAEGGSGAAVRRLNARYQPTKEKHMTKRGTSATAMRPIASGTAMRPASAAPD
jgi:hypothetical protein